MLLEEVLPAVRAGQTAEIFSATDRAQLALRGICSARREHNVCGWTAWFLAGLPARYVFTDGWQLLGPVSLEDIPEPEAKT